MKTIENLREKMVQLEMLENCINDLENRRNWYCTYDEDGKPIKPTEDDTFNYIRYQAMTKIIEKLYNEI